MGYNIVIRVTDAVTGEPLPKAWVNVFEADGSLLVDHAPVNAQGEYLLDSDGEANTRGQFLSVEAPGHHQSAAELPIYGDSLALDIYPVEVPWFLIGAGVGLGAMLLFSRRKKQAVGAIDPKAVTPWVGPVVGVGLLGLVVYKVGQKFGLFDDEAAKQRKAEAEQREKDAAASMETVCRLDPSTKTASDWVDITDQIENALDYAGYLSSYEDKAVYQLCRAQNDCDVLNMIYYFGHRQLRDVFLIKGGPFARDYTLSQGIQERLSTDNIGIINNNYFNKGIKFRW